MAASNQIVRGGAGRLTRYAARRPIPGLPSPLSLYELDARGSTRLARLHAVYPSGFFVESESPLAGFQADLPWFLHDLRPRGVSRAPHPRGLPDARPLARRAALAFGSRPGLAQPRGRGTVSLEALDAEFYDMLPMAFHPQDGELVERALPVPELTTEDGASWRAAFADAQEYWRRIVADPAYTPDMHRIAGRASASHDSMPDIVGRLPD